MRSTENVDGPDECTRMRMSLMNEETCCMRFASECVWMYVNGCCGEWRWMRIYLGIPVNEHRCWLYVNEWLWEASSNVLCFFMKQNENFSEMLRNVVEWGEMLSGKNHTHVGQKSHLSPHMGVWATHHRQGRDQHDQLCTPPYVQMSSHGTDVGLCSADM